MQPPWVSKRGRRKGQLPAEQCPQHLWAHPTAADAWFIYHAALSSCHFSGTRWHRSAQGAVAVPRLSPRSPAPRAGAEALPSRGTSDRQRAEGAAAALAGSRGFRCPSGDRR